MNAHNFRRSVAPWPCAAAVLSYGAFSARESKAEAIDASITYIADLVSPVRGGIGNDAGLLDDLDFRATLDLGALAGVHGTTLFAHVLNNDGQRPNDVAATLQGIDNIEVAQHRLRLYELWVERAIGDASLRAGLYDLNSEFYTNEAAGLLIAPAFGIGSELAATGVNGPSIFPSTALALRLTTPISEHSTLKAAVLNARAGVLGDPGGVDTSFDGGALLIAEWSWSGVTQIGVGAWRYTQRQDDIRTTNGAGQPNGRVANGIYLTAERRVWGEEDGRNATAFVRLGVSDGDTTPYSGGWQAGVLIDHLLVNRPDSQLSLGAYQGRFDPKQRSNMRDIGISAATAETGIELTYSDQVSPWLRLQPDVQFVLNPAGDRDREALWIAGLRLAITPHAQSDQTGT